MQPGIERSNCEIRMKGIGRRDYHCIEAARQQSVDVGVHLLQAVAFAQRSPHRRRSIGKHDELEPLPLLPQIERVLGLSHQASADQSNP